METVTKVMSQDHHRCDELFARLEDQVSSNDWDQAEQGLHEFLTAMEKHFQREEEILFPAIDGGVGSGPTAVMRSEHVQMRELFWAMQDSLERRDEDDFLGNSETLLIVMQQHNAKEEQILYPMIDDALGERAVEMLKSPGQG